MRKAREPESINWENLHLGKGNLLKLQAKIYTMGILMLIVSLGCVFGFQIFDQEANNRYNMMRECGERGELITISQAYKDYILPANRRRDLTKCYCQSQFRVAG